MSASAFVDMTQRDRDAYFASESVTLVAGRDETIALLSRRYDEFRKCGAFEKTPPTREQYITECLDCIYGRCAEEVQEHLAW